MVYQTIRAEFSGVVFAVCGERTPIAFMSDVAWNWEYTADGLLLRKGTKLSGSTIVMETTLLKPIDDIVLLALQQPPYREQWQRDAAFHQDDPYTDDLVESVERGDGPP